MYESITSIVAFSGNISWKVVDEIRISAMWREGSVHNTVSARVNHRWACILSDGTIPVLTEY